MTCFRIYQTIKNLAANYSVYSKCLQYPKTKSLIVGELANAVFVQMASLTKDIIPSKYASFPWVVEGNEVFHDRKFPYTYARWSDKCISEGRERILFNDTMVSITGIRCGERHHCSNHLTITRSDTAQTNTKVRL